MFSEIMSYIWLSSFRRLFLLSKINLGVMFSEIVFVVKDKSWSHVFRDCVIYLVSSFQRLILLSKKNMGVMFSEIVFVVKDISLCHIFRDCFCCQRYICVQDISWCHVFRNCQRYILVLCFQRLCQRYSLPSFQRLFLLSKIYLGFIFKYDIKLTSGN